jgi:glycosyltransferase involved in cell wall biosynthesis
MNKLQEAFRIALAFLKSDDKMKKMRLFFVVLKRDGLKEVKRRVFLLIYQNKNNAISRDDLLSTSRNIFKNQQIEFSRDDIKVKMDAFTVMPFFSVIMPVYNTHPKWIERAIESLIKQVYDNWELCVVDDYSEDGRVRAILTEYAKKDTRIKVYFSQKNSGISITSNIALEMTEGEYVALLDHDDELTSDALFWMANEINNHNDAEIIYSDECKIDEKDNLFDFHFKPKWSPELLLNSMYIGHLTVYKKSLMQNFGGFRSEYDFSQDYDLALRISEQTDYIYHVERVLYFWRAIEGSAAKGGKDFARVSNLRALKAAALRRKIKNFRIIETPSANYLNIIGDISKKVSIIIPTDSYANLKRSIDSIFTKTAYSNYEIVAVCNSLLANQMEKEYSYADILKFSRYDKVFNFSDKCNQGVADSSGDIIIFYNDDVIPIESSWIEKLIEYLAIPGVGGVSPKLLFENGNIQYAGMVSGTPGLIGTAFNNWREDDSSDFLSLHKLVRNVSVLSGACCALKKTTFFSIGQYDSKNTPNGHSDVDLSYRILDAGLRCVYTPYATLIHIGNHTWNPQKDEQDKADIFLLKRWPKYLSEDRYFTDTMKKVLYRDFTYNFKVFSNIVKSDLYGTKNILLISHELSLTGAPIMLFAAAKELKKNGFYPVVISPEDGFLRKEFEKENIPVIVDEMIFKKHWLTEKFIKNFDLIVANTVMTFPIIEQLESYGVSILWWLHESAGLNFLKKFPNKESILHRCKKIIFVSNYASRFLEVPSNKLCILQNGTKDVFIESETNKKGQRLKFCVIGTIEQRKGQDIFVEAIKLIPKEIRARAKFFIVGRKSAATSFVNDLKERVSEIKEIELFEEMSHEEVLNFIQNSDVLVCPSRDDSASLVTIEAMSLQKAIITSDHVGVSEKLEDSVSCLSFPSEDIGKLASKMRFLIENPKKIEEIGKMARSIYLNEFTLEKFGKNFLQIVNTSIKNGKN